MIHLDDFTDAELDDAADVAENACTSWRVGERPVETVHFPALSPATMHPMPAVRIDDDGYGWWDE